MVSVSDSRQNVQSHEQQVNLHSSQRRCAWSSFWQGHVSISAPPSSSRVTVNVVLHSVQEASAKIAPRQCGRIEQVIQAMAPIDPNIAGTLLGVLIGFAAPEDQPICPRRP